MKLHVFGYDLFALVRKPDEVARLAMLVARADVDARLTACDELAHQVAADAETEWAAVVSLRHSWRSSSICRRSFSSSCSLFRV